MVVFGDSFSDGGNTFDLSNGSWPEPLYYPGGRFSNGKVWTDYVTEARRFRTTNFAYGGATTDSKVVQGYSGREADIPVPGFHQQLDTYSAELKNGDAGDEKLNSTLFVVSFQGNDFIFDPNIRTEQVLSNIEHGIRRLIEKMGAQHLIVVENFDFGKVPYFLFNSTLSREKTALAQKQYREYQELIQRLRRDYGGSKRSLKCKEGSENGSNADSTTGKRKANIVFFDLYALFDKLHCPRQLRRLGIRDIDHGCVDDRATKQCESPSEHFFYDSFHPSTKVHREVANGILGLI
ncbi:hypothetical protein EMPS_05170 [Entomortierella parvispora]|uniref:Carbohydrate esterase family 16 protein n=1 Tax=Entomortierella parvispora TaxID=205924 RepID=A0A9P3HAM7_9FUNG|nr:hypothetical protein EMPS_05170 [Entomortierella parvispora]